MPAQQKLFRIEAMMQALAPEDREVAETLAAHSEILAEIRALRGLLESRPAAEPRAEMQSPELRKLKIELDVIGTAIKQTRSEIVSLQHQGFDSAQVARVARELEAAFEDTSAATDTVLKAAEEIDERASALVATLKTANEGGLAQDIQEKVTTIFEACNFHDLTGQRITKVAMTLKLVEEHLARMMEIWSVIERFNVDDAQAVAHQLDSMLNGPKLNGDNGHSTQDEIDALFK